MDEVKDELAVKLGLKQLIVGGKVVAESKGSETILIFRTCGREERIDIQMNGDNISQVALPQGRRVN